MLNILKKTTIYGLASFILSGCSDPNDPNIDTMKAAVQQGIEDINCRKIQNRHRRKREFDISHSSACESLDQMTEVGILTRVYKGNRVVYSPRDEYLHEFKLVKVPYTDGNIMFCPGKPKVTEVTLFTVPAEKNGMKMSIVSFTWKVDLPQPIQKLYDAGVFRRGFSKKCKTFDPFYSEVILEGSGSMPVVLTNDGWKPATKMKLQ